MPRTPRPDVAGDLLESWINGNRSWVRAELAKRTKRGALAMLARMLDLATDDIRADLIRSFARD